MPRLLSETVNPLGLLRVAVPTLAAVVLAACGGASDGNNNNGPAGYAGLTREQVRAYAESKLRQAEDQGQGGILRLNTIVRDENDAGRPVWLIVMDDLTTGGELCIQTWATENTIHNSEPVVCSGY